MCLSFCLSACMQGWLYRARPISQCPPVITNVGGCGGQSSGHAPPRRVIPDYPRSARVNLKPRRVDFSLSSRLTLPYCVTHGHLVAHCSRHTSGSEHLTISSCELRAPRSTPQRQIQPLTRTVTPRRDGMTCSLACTIEKEAPTAKGRFR